MQHSPNIFATARLGIRTTWLLTVLGNTLLGVLFALFAFAAFRTWRDTGHVQMLLLAVQELIIVGLVVTRRRTQEMSLSPWDWAIALLGTAAPLLQQPSAPLHTTLEPLGLLVQLVGAALSLLATISLGRSFGIVAANRGVRTGGLYRFVRHPLYGSYLIGYVGFLIGNASTLNLLLIALAATCQYLRGRSEERVLARDPAYRAYMKRVRYRFLPGVF
jgi:protein-S-isoprenylcysteine O-methyltransferase Ste14